MMITVLSILILFTNKKAARYYVFIYVFLSIDICSISANESKKETEILRRPDCLEALWHFEEGNGNICEASSTDKYILHLKRVEWAEGKKGKCLLFNGKNGYGYIPEISAHLNNEFTISVWIKPDYIYPQKYILLDCLFGSRGPGFMFFISYGRIRFLSGDGKERWIVCTPKFKNGKLPAKVFRKGYWYEGKFANRWYHVALTYKDGIYKIYIDGVIACTQKNRGVMPNFKTKTLFVGASSRKEGCFKGLIDELEILGRAKTGKEIIADSIGEFP